jgi:hypothetical protein
LGIKKANEAANPRAAQVRFEKAKPFADPSTALAESWTAGSIAYQCKYGSTLRTPWGVILMVIAPDVCVR